MMTSRDPGAWMLAEAIELIERAERLHKQFFRLVASPARRLTWEPPLDIFESDQELQILIALPGVPPSQIRITMEGSELVVSGDRPLPRECAGSTIQRLEIPHGRFERRIELPQGDLELQRQELDNGCLVLTLRKR